MSMACPECGGRKLRLSKVRGVLERIGTIFGVYPMKCSECHERFYSRIWNISHLLFAKCPRCHKMDLSKWSDHHYHAPVSLQIQLALGAQRRRCVYCRHNFASWRPLKEVYDARRRVARSHVRTPVPPRTEEDRTDGNDLPHTDDMLRQQ
jgi:hypothetical protein